MSHGTPPPTPHSSWPGPLPKPAPQHRPPPHHPDYLLPWQSSETAPDPDSPNGADTPAPTPAATATCAGCAPRTGCCGAPRH